MNQSIETMAITHAARMAILALIMTHPNPKLLKEVLMALIQASDKQLDHNTLMHDNVGTANVEFRKVHDEMNNMFLAVLDQTISAAT